MNGKITPGMLIGQVAEEHPEARRVLSALGIDYAYNGMMPLSTAASQTVLPIDTVVAALNTTMLPAKEYARTEPAWKDAPFEELLEYLEVGHQRYRQHIVLRLEELLEGPAHARAPEHADLLDSLAVMVDALTTHLDAHLEREERDLLPAITRLRSGEWDESIFTLLDALTQEHTETCDILGDLRLITHEDVLPVGECLVCAEVCEVVRALESNLLKHIHLENHVLFPRVRALASQAPAAAPSSFATPCRGDH